jgi:hypothetical protein
MDADRTQRQPQVFGIGEKTSLKRMGIGKASDPTEKITQFCVIFYDVLKTCLSRVIILKFK